MFSSVWLHADDRSNPDLQLSIPLWRNADEKASRTLIPPAEVEEEEDKTGSEGSESTQPKAKNYCKVISLQIPLPSNERVGSEKTSLPRDPPKCAPPPKATTTRLNIKQLEFLLFGEDQRVDVSCPTKLPLEPRFKPALHPSHKELAAACGRGTRPPWELRGPHPSVQYPNLCLQPRKAASGQSSNGQTFRCTQWRTMADGESSETAKTDLQPLSDLPPVRTVSNRQVTSGSQLELTCSSIVIEGDGKLGGRPLTHLSRCSCRFCTTRRSKKQALYLDPLANGPSGYHRRLTEIAILVSDTVRWEKKKQTKRSKQSVSQGSLSV